jgi:hypothetical protein
MTEHYHPKKPVDFKPSPKLTGEARTTRLSQLARIANAGLEKCVESIGLYLNYAKEVGDALNEAKTILGQV